jgi:hypothetical protein
VLSPYAGACLGLDSVQYGVRYADSGGLHRRLMSEKCSSILTTQYRRCQTNVAIL